MFKTLIAGLTAISLTLGSAAPVQAQGMSEDDIGKLLFGLLTAGVVAKIISNNNDHDAPAAEQQYMQQAPTTQTWRDRNHRNSEPTYHQRHNNVTPWQRQAQAHQNASPSQNANRPRTHNNLRALPAQCLKSKRTRYGVQQIFTRGCLRRNYQQFARLPSRCAIRIQSNTGPVPGFDPQCLSNSGLTVRRR